MTSIPRGAANEIPVEYVDPNAELEDLWDYVDDEASEVAPGTAEDAAKYAEGKFKFVLVDGRFLAEAFSPEVYHQQLVTRLAPDDETAYSRAVTGVLEVEPDRISYYPYSADGKGGSDPALEEQIRRWYAQTHAASGERASD